jgi:hypothetical protein
VATPDNEAALKRNVTPGPNAATINPPRAGPATLAILNDTEPSVIAETSSLRETSSGIIDCHAGAFIDAPRLRKNVKVSSIKGVILKKMVVIPSSSAAVSISNCVKISSRLRSKISAIAPAGREKRKKGSVVAV